ncbi:MAG: Fe-S cluster assembly protein SufD [Sciscionella sp.]|nr:Fe-S cluster assembly protein SufD [Sciscionella sp.]
MPETSRAQRFSSFDVEAFEVPTGREENWRFTPMRRLRGLHDGSAPATAKITIDVDLAPELTLESLSRKDCVDASGAGGHGVDASGAGGHGRLGVAGVPGDRIAAQAWSAFDTATVLTVPSETKASAPSTVTITGPGEDQTAYGHLQLRAESFAEAAIVLDHRGSGTYADNVEIVVDDGAKLTVVSIADWADDAVHVSEHHVKLGRDATLKHIVVTLGGDLVRISPTVTFAGEGGNAELTGLYFADAGQHFEHRPFIDHAQPHCTSDVTYKGALQGDEARTVWIGDVLIRAAAEGTKTFELNRNLVLTENARADSVPNLEIETGEIEGAGHASATGRFDDEQLFYLQARGIPEGAARRLVVRGFFHELLAKIDIPELRERLAAAIEAELEAVGA